MCAKTRDRYTWLPPRGSSIDIVLFSLWWPVTECFQNMIYIYICQLWQLWPCYEPGVLGGDRGKHVNGVQQYEQCLHINISWICWTMITRKVEVSFCWNPFKEMGTVGNVHVWKICMFNCLWSPSADHCEFLPFQLIAAHRALCSLVYCCSLWANQLPRNNLLKNWDPNLSMAMDVCFAKMLPVYPPVHHRAVTSSLNVYTQ